MKKSLSESNILKEIWLKHFDSKNSVFVFNFLEGVSFLKSKYLPIFQSIGGASFMLSNAYKPLSAINNAGKNNVYVIYNIPSYNETPIILSNRDYKLRLNKLRDYEGYRINFSKYDTIGDYFKNQLGSKKLGNIRRRQKKLEHCFNISYTLYYNEDLNQELYLWLMKELKELLIRKFESKKEFYIFTSDAIWAYYTDLIHEMISNGEASLFVVSNDGKPISFYISYHFDSYVMGVMPVFDLDYSKFGLGAITIKKLLESLYAMGVRRYDFYKGEYGYKKDWCNETYFYEHHVLYNQTLLSKTIAHVLSFKFKIKQYLIKKGVNNLYYKILFYLKNSKNNVSIKYKTLEIADIELSKMNLEFISILDNEYKDIRRFVYEFLYSNNLFVSNITVYKNDEVGYVIKTENKNLHLIHDN